MSELSEASLSTIARKGAADTLFTQMICVRGLTERHEVDDEIETMRRRLRPIPARRYFVNRLQMTLFGWIKKHPSPKGMLYVIDEAQTFIPSGAGALSKTSGVTLVAQAQKYGSA